MIRKIVKDLDVMIGKKLLKLEGVNNVMSMKGHKMMAKNVVKINAK